MKLPRLIMLLGGVATGKDFLAQLLAREICYEYRCFGNGARAEADRLGMTLHQWIEAASKNPSMNIPVDAPIKRMVVEDWGVVNTSRIGHLFAYGIADIKKIRIDSELHVAASRVGNRDFKHLPPQERYHQGLREVHSRNTKDAERYPKLCKLPNNLTNYLDDSLFDLIVPNNDNTPDKPLGLMLDFIRKG